MDAHNLHADCRAYDHGVMAFSAWAMLFKCSSSGIRRWANLCSIEESCHRDLYQVENIYHAGLCFSNGPHGLLPTGPTHWGWLDEPVSRRNGIIETIPVNPAGQDLRLSHSDILGSQLIWSYFSNYRPSLISWTWLPSISHVYHASCQEGIFGTISC